MSLWWYAPTEAVAVQSDPPVTSFSTPLEGTDDTTVTNGSGGGDPLAGVYTSNATMTFQTEQKAHGSSSVEIKTTALGSTPTVSQIEIALDQYRSRTLFSAYWRIASVPDKPVTFYWCYRAGYGTCFAAVLNADRTISLQYGSGATTKYTSSMALSTGTWYRLEFLADQRPAADTYSPYCETTLQLKIYSGDSTTPLETVGGVSYDISSLFSWSSAYIDPTYVGTSATYMDLFVDSVQVFWDEDTTHPQPWASENTASVTGEGAVTAVATVIAGASAAGVGSVSADGSSVGGAEVAYDTSSNLAETNNNGSWTHTPVGTPKGAIVVVTGEAYSGVAVTAVTYGGTSMTKVAEGYISASDAMFAQVWFLGSGLGTGAKTVATTSSTGDYYIATCYTVTTSGGGDTEVVDYDGGSVTSTAVNTSMTIPSGRKVFMAGGLSSDTSAVTNVTDGADLTRSHSDDHGSMVDIINRRTSIYTGTGSAYTGFSWTISTSLANAFAVVAIAEEEAAIAYGTADVDGVGAVTALARQQAGATVAGTGSVTASGVAAVFGSATVAGAGTVSALARQQAGSSTSGAGSVSALALQQAGATIAGVGSVTANASVQTNIGATVRGEGRIGGASGDDMIIPFYIYPTSGSDWDDIIADPKGIGYIIANDRSGNLAGQSADANYTSYLAAAKAAGIKILYYVDTNYTAISYATVTANMDAWVSFYGQPDGWFFDQAAAGSGDVAYYQALYSYGSGSGARKIVLNHGTTPHESFLSSTGACDITVIAENTAATIHAWSVWPSWLSSYSADRYCVLAYNATNVRDTWGSIPPGIKYKYVADASAWYALPTFYSTEVTLSSSKAKATIQAGSTVTGAGTVTTAVTIRATASVVGTGTVVANGSGAMQGVATVTGAGTVVALATQRAGSTVAGVGTVSASVVQRGQASVTGAGSVSATGQSLVFGTASVVGAGSVSAFVRQQAGSTVVGNGSVSSTVIQRATATVVGTGTVVANQSGQGAATIVGAGSVTALATLRSTSSASGVGSVANSGIIQRATATVTGAGTVVATGVGQAFGTATVVGAGAVTANGTVVILGSASVQGVGAVSAAGGIKIMGSASIVGRGEVTLENVNIGSTVKKFTTPTMDRTIDRTDSIGYRHMTHGISVLNTGGVFTEHTYPSDLECEAADYVYMGGRTYRISEAEASALVGAGYSVSQEQEWTQV